MPTRQNLALVAVVVVGALLAVVSYQFVSKFERSAAELTFTRPAADLISGVQLHIETEIESVRSLVAFYNSSSFVDRAEFNSFVAPSLARYESIQALEWVPRVAAADRDEFEKRARNDGFENFQFIERSGSGDFVSARQREEYFPVFYLEPMEQNEAAFGFDLGSNAPRLKAIEKARDSGEMVASGRVSLVQTNKNTSGVLLFAPIYTNKLNDSSIEARREHLLGFALGVFRISRLLEASVLALESIQETANRSHTDLLLFDADGDKDGQLLAAFHSGKGGDAAFPLSLGQARQGLHLEHTFSIGGRSWIIVAVAGDHIELLWEPWAAMVVVLLLTILIAVYLATITRRTFVIEGLVQERTRQLQQRTEELVARTGLLELMQTVTAAANDAEEVVDAFRAGLAKVCEFSGCQIGHAYVLAPGSHGRLVSGDVWYISDPERFAPFKEKTAQQVFDVGVGLPGRVWETQRPVWIVDVTRDPNFPRAQVAKDVGIRSGFAMPVIAGSEVAAILEFFTTEEITPDDSLLRTLEQIGVQLGRTVERKEIERLKNEFISTVSHELRTPLTSIKGSLGLIKASVVGELPERLSGMVDIAYNNSDRLVRLINDILDIERMEAGKMDFRVEPLNIVPLVQQAMAANTGLALQREIKFEFNANVEKAWILGDEDRLVQVVTNLLSNAVKFSPLSGFVNVSITILDNNVHVSVSDQGPGISEEFQSRIFEKFSQADASDTRAKGGSGLGLNICKAIVEKLDGEIGFTTEIGKGASFYFTLPLWTAPTLEISTERQPGLVSEHDLLEPRILVCEDDQDIATLLSLILQQNGFAPDIAYDADQAQVMLAKSQYAAMTLDLQLPGKDGITFLRELRENAETRDLPVVVISVAASEGASEANGDAIGVVDWLTKPIDEERLIRALGVVVDDRNGHRFRILHVEDEPDISELISGIIAGFADLIPVRTNAEARQKLENETFDLVILDLQLPDGNGADLLPFLRQKNKKPTPVIVLSASDPGDELAARVSSVLIKSRISNEQILDTIRGSISSSRAGHVL